MLLTTVGEDEARRRAKRRERNRVAAARCRQRRQDQIVELQYRVGTLTRTGDELRSSLQSLNTERLRLEGLIRQHGFAGCTEAEDLLNSSSMNTEKPDSCCDVNMASGELSAPKCSTSSFVALKDIVFNPVSTSPSPNSPGLILITNSATPTKMECETSETVGMARPALAKLDLRRVSQLNCSPNVTVCVPHSAASGFDSVTTSNGCAPLKMDEPMSDRGEGCRTVTATGSPATLSPPTSLSRIAARPSTLIPSKLVTDLTKLSNVLVTENATSSTACPTIKDTPTPCFWPSDLQSLSPILTPSTWKLLKNLTSTSCSTSQSFLLTPTFSSLCPTLSVGSLASPTASGAVSLFASVTTSSAGNSGNLTTTQSANDINTSLNDHTALSTGGRGDTPVPSNGQTVYLAFSNCDKMEPPEEAKSSALQ
ncbi:uncharacterized protein DEA37_0000605 [Paragonimus westermani]|uniref:BZIP domain-containing protein n=1 Tax=Paragonimus westermani TaxID=34504 RepID=A0A5J4P253_9TREM|nr:uncharacterized protein DEA37_0000605 [Paragonimus westermani]